MYLILAFGLEGVDALDGDLGADEAEDGLGRELSVELIRGIIEDQLILFFVTFIILERTLPGLNESAPAPDCTTLRTPFAPWPSG